MEKSLKFLMKKIGRLIRCEESTGVEKQRDKRTIEFSKEQERKCGNEG